MNKLIILDLDGTLVDSLADIHAAANHMLTFFGIAEATKETVRGFVGDGTRVFVERLLAGNDQRDTDRALRVFHDYYRAHSLDQTHPYPGMDRVLDELEATGWTVGVLSNKDTHLCKAVISQLPELTGRFSFVFGGDSFDRRKPSPEPVERILKMTGINRERAVMVGDSSNDVGAGQNAGIHTIAVSYGFTDREELMALAPDRIVDVPVDLPAVAESLIGSQSIR